MSNFLGMLLAIMAAIAGCSTQSSAIRESATTARARKFPAYVNLEAAFNVARLQNVPLLSPGFYGAAQSALEKAREAAEGQLGSSIARAKDLLFKATKQSDETRTVLADVMDARSQARKIKEGTSQEEIFQRAEAKLRDLAVLIEDGRMPEALIRKGAVVRAYLDCHRNFEANRTLGAARLALDQAGREGAAELTPLSFSAAQKTLGQAERFAEIHPGAYNELPRRTREAYFYANRALRETQTAERTKSTGESSLPPLPAVSTAE